MRAILALVSLTLLASGCGSGADDEAAPASRTLSDFGVTLELPDGWDGSSYVNETGLRVLQAANFPLPPEDDDVGNTAKQGMTEDGIHVSLWDWPPDPRMDEESFVPSELPIQIDRTHFNSFEGFGSETAARTVSVMGRLLQVIVSFGRPHPGDELLADANRVLGSLTIEPSSTAPTIAGYGLSAHLPAGWNGRVARGALQAASFALPPEGDRWEKQAVAEMEAGEVVVLLLENAGSDDPFVHIDRLPPVALSDFAARTDTAGLETHGVVSRAVSLDERNFVVWIESGSRPLPETRLREVNELLASISVEGGDFYPGTVAPAEFEPAPGWYVGTNGPTERRADFEEADTWAATIPLDADPYQTLRSLPADGIVISLRLSRYWPQTPENRRWAVRRTPFRLGDFEVRHTWKGMIGEIPEHLLLAQIEGEYEVDLRVYFGRADPTPEMLARAQEELNRLRLPDWGRWELE